MFIILWNSGIDRCLVCFLAARTWGQPHLLQFQLQLESIINRYAKAIIRHQLVILVIDCAAYVTKTYSVLLNYLTCGEGLLYNVGCFYHKSNPL